MGSFILYVLQGLLSMLVLAIIVSAILSWLVAFNVVNMRNGFVYGVVRFLDAVTRPILAPFQRLIPSLGGVDLSPIVVILILQGAQRYLLPWLFRPIQAMIG